MKKLFGMALATLTMGVIPSFAAFSESSFNYGVMWDGAQKLSDFTGLSHIAMYAGDGSRDIYNPYWEGTMLRKCKEKGLTPVFYAYIIAEWDKHYGRSDCDMGSPNHCTHGADLIRNHWDEIIGRYKDLANGVKNDYGTSGTSIWLIEPDFFQYSVSGDAHDTRFSQVGGGIPDKDLAGKYFNEIVAAIKSVLPNAKIGVDISPWLNEGLKSWYDNFDKSKVDYLFNSGGRTQGDQSRIRNDNNNMLTWAQASSYMGGKKIIADDGYGVGGGAENNYGEWLVRSNLNARIADGVIGLTLKDPGNDFYTFAKNNPIALSGSTNPTSSNSSNRSSSSQWQGGISSAWLPSSSSQGSTGGTSFALTTANLIDDFEDGDSTAYTGTTDTWFAFTDAGDKGASSLTNTKNATGYNVVFTADNGSKYMAGLKGITLKQGSNPYDPYVTLGLDINGGLKNCKTISYKYKGAAHNLKAVTKGDESGALSEYNYHKLAVSGSTSWQTKTLAPSAMSQEAGWGKTFTLNASNIVKLQWEVKGTASTNSLYVDDVACDGMNIVRPASSSSSVRSSSSVKSSSSVAVSSSSVKSSSSVASSSSVRSSSSAKSSSSMVSSSSVVSSSSMKVSSSSVVGGCIAYTAGTGGYADHCYNSGLTGMGEGKCYTLNPDRDPKTQWVNNNVAETYWWVETSCGDVASSSSAASSSSSVKSSSSVAVSSSSSVPVVTVFNLAAANTTQEVVAGQAITPIVYNFENVRSVSVAGLPKGLTGTLDNAAKTYTISGTVDAALGTKDYGYTIAVTGVESNVTAAGVIKVTRAPVVTTVALTRGEAEQSVVAGSAIESIVYTYANATDIKVTGLPAGLSAQMDQKAKTCTISGTVDASLGTNNYEYTVTVSGLDNNVAVTGVIKVSRLPVVTTFALVKENSIQEVIAGNAIENIVYQYENLKTLKISGLPLGLNAVLDKSTKTYRVTGTVDPTLGTHDYEYTIEVEGIDENLVVKGTIKVKRAPVVTEFILSSGSAEQSVVAGETIEPIVYSFMNVTGIKVTGLPKGLSAVLNESAKTYTISGTVDASLSDHDYAYTVTVTGVDENASASGVIKVKEAPNSSSSEVVVSSSSEEPVVSSSSEQFVESSSSAIPVQSSSSEIPVESSSSEESSSSVVPSSSSETPIVSSSSEALTESSSSSEPASSSSEVQSSSSVIPNSSSSVIPDVDLESSSSVESSSSADSSSSVASSSSSEQLVESSSSEMPMLSSSSEIPVESSSSVIPDTDPELSSSSEGSQVLATNMSGAFKMGFANNQLTLSMLRTSDVSVQVFDMMGNMVMSQRVATSGNAVLSMNSMRQGSYMVRVIDGSAVRVARIIIK